MIRYTEILVNVFLTGMFILVGGILVYTPISSYQSAQITREALNEQCGTDYSTMDVLFSGEQLRDLCKMKNQQLLIKQ